MDQLTLPFFQKEPLIRAHLQSRVNRPVSLCITDNTCTMLSVRKKGVSFVVRLNRIFLHAGDDILDEVADYMRGSVTRTPLIREFIDLNTPFLKKSAPRKISLRQRGMHHDLAEIFSRLNKIYFDDRVTASITWGYRKSRPGTYQRTLGSYNNHDRLIRINPSLDSRSVPRYFLEFIVYHEMLHADIGLDERPGRRTVHCRDFKKRERLFRNYDRAVQWEKKRWG